MTCLSFIILFVIQVETHSGICSMPIVALAMNMLTFYCIGLFATLCKIHQLLLLLHNRLLYAELWFSPKHITLCKIRTTKSLGSDLSYIKTVITENRNSLEELVMKSCYSKGRLWLWAAVFLLWVMYILTFFSVLHFPNTCCFP